MENFESGHLRFEVLTQHHQLPRIKHAWEHLHKRCQASAFISYAWCLTQCQYSERPRILCAFEQQHLVFVLPLQELSLSPKVKLEALQHLCKPYTDLQECLIAPHIKLERFSRAFWHYIEKSALPRHLHLSLVASNSHLAMLLKHTPKHFRTDQLPSTPTLYCELQRLQLSSKLLRNNRSRQNKLQQNHRVEFCLQQTLSARVFTQALVLNQQRHGVSLINKTSERVRLWQLFSQLPTTIECSYIKIDGKIAAVHIGFLHHDELQHYLTGFDQHYRHYGVGVMLLLAMIRHYQQSGIRHINFLRGQEPYKRQLSTHQRELQAYLVHAPHATLPKQWLMHYWRARQWHQQQLNSQAYAIVLANGLNGLGAIKSLHQAKIQSLCIFPSKRDLGAYSRYPKAKHYVPFDKHWERNLLHLLSQLSKQYAFPLPIFACSDRAANFLQNYATRLPKNILCLTPSKKLIEQLNDKSQELALLKTTSVTLPKSVNAPSPIRPFDNLSLPIIIKPRSYADYAFLGAKNYIANNQDELEIFYQRFKGHYERFIAQEVIEGNDETLWVCNACFDKQHRMCSAFTFQRLGTSPSHFGVTSAAYSKDNPDIKAQVAELGKRLGYVGPGMWEFKFDASTKKYYYIETNPRLGMCNWFDSACGINNLLSCYHILTQGHYSLEQKQQEGPYFLHALNDLVARLEDRETLTSITQRYRRLSGRPRVWAIFDWQDPWPALRQSISMSVMIATRLYRALRRKLNKGASTKPWLSKRYKKS